MFIDLFWQLNVDPLYKWTALIIFIALLLCLARYINNKKTNKKIN